MQGHYKLFSFNFILFDKRVTGGVLGHQLEKHKQLGVPVPKKKLDCHDTCINSSNSPFNENECSKTLLIPKIAPWSGLHLDWLVSLVRI